MNKLSSSSLSCTNTNQLPFPEKYYNYYADLYRTGEVLPLFPQLQMFMQGRQCEDSILSLLPRELTQKVAETFMMYCQSRIEESKPFLSKFGECHSSFLSASRRRFLACLSNPSVLKVNLTFKKGMAPAAMLKDISLLEQPEVIFWYIGEYGLKTEGVNFYKKRLMQPMSKIAPQANCRLYDLTAWKALRDRDVPLSAYNPNVDRINGFSMPNLSCMKSSEFFSWLNDDQSSETSKNRLGYLCNFVTNRDFIFKASKLKSDNKIQMAELFPFGGENDTAKWYSALQYMEGLYLVEKIFSQACEKFRRTGDDNAPCNIVFALPNDEYKYYEDPNNNFVRDIKILLSNRGEFIGREINIFFYCFKFNKLENRPYNAGKAVIEEIGLEQMQ